MMIPHNKDLTCFSSSVALALAFSNTSTESDEPFFWKQVKEEKNNLRRLQAENKIVLKMLKEHLKISIQICLNK